MYTPRFNPNSAVSNWKSRLDYLKGYPGKAMSAVMNGGFFGSSIGLEYSNGSVITNNDTGDGYNYFAMYGSGNLTVTGSATVEILVVGGGGGFDTGSATVNKDNGAGGGGGSVWLSNVTLGAGTYSVVCGVAGTFGASAGWSGTNGGSSSITVDGVHLSGGGGGRGGQGGYGYCTAGSTGSPGTSPGSNYVSRAGGGGGGGVWYGYCGRGGGAGGTNYIAGTIPMTVENSFSNGSTAKSGGSANGSYATYSGGGGDGWGDYDGQNTGYGARGRQWKDWPGNDNWFGNGGGTYGYLYPYDAALGTIVYNGWYGRGATSNSNLHSQAYAAMGGIVIVRYP